MFEQNVLENFGIGMFSGMRPPFYLNSRFMLTISCQEISAHIMFKLSGNDSLKKIIGKS